MAISRHTCNMRVYSENDPRFTLEAEPNPHRPMQLLPSCLKLFLTLSLSL